MPRSFRANRYRSMIRGKIAEQEAKAKAKAAPAPRDPESPEAARTPARYAKLIGECLGEEAKS